MRRRLVRLRLTWAFQNSARSCFLPELQDVSWFVAGVPKTTVLGSISSLPARRSGNRHRGNADLPRRSLAAAVQHFCGLHCLRFSLYTPRHQSNDNCKSALDNKVFSAVNFRQRVEAWVVIAEGHCGRCFVESGHVEVFALNARFFEGSIITSDTQSEGSDCVEAEVSERMGRLLED